MKNEQELGRFGDGEEKENFTKQKQHVKLPRGKITKHNLAC